MVISKRGLEVLPDGSMAPALAVDSDGTLYGMPPSKGVLKLGNFEMARRVALRYAARA